MVSWWIWALAVGAFLRLLMVLPWRWRRPAHRASRVRLMVVLGSGGHTTEALHFLGAMDMQRYQPRSYIVAHSDNHSEAKAREFERHHEQPFGVHVIPRSREVGQSYFTSVFTTLRAMVTALWVVVRNPPDMLLMNGPGTCIPICVCTYVAKFFALCNTYVVYVESVSRVKRLSLSGSLLYHLRLTNAFIVQWPQLQQAYQRSTYLGDRLF